MNPKCNLVGGEPHILRFRKLYGYKVRLVIDLLSSYFGAELKRSKSGNFPPQQTSDGEKAGSEHFLQITALENCDRFVYIS